MQLIRGLYNLGQKLAKGCVATIGNYDGVHLGHQKIIKALKEKSTQLQLPSVVVLFEPQPGEFFAGKQVFRLTGLCEKILLLQEYGIDYVLALPFDVNLANLDASRFILDVLVNLLKAKYLIVGDDFVFGHNREGDFGLLKQIADKFGFEVIKIEPFKIDGVRVSSSLIRAALCHNDLEIATKFLGRHYGISGKVISGDNRGRKLGFPTANIHLKHLLSFDGVYFVKILGLADGYLYGLANIGFRPTVSGKKRTFEVYIFDFDADIYGKRIKVEFLRKIRDEIKFDSLEKLKAQIEKDVEEGVRHRDFYLGV